MNKKYHICTNCGAKYPCPEPIDHFTGELVKNPRKRKGEGEFKYELRYAEADLLFHDNLRDTVGNLIQVINDAKSEMPTKKKFTKREALGSGLYRYSFDSSAFMKEWDAWAKKYFGES